MRSYQDEVPCTEKKLFQFRNRDEDVYPVARWVADKLVDCFIVSIGSGTMFHGIHDLSSDAEDENYNL